MGVFFRSSPFIDGGPVISPAILFFSRLLREAFYHAEAYSSAAYLGTSFSLRAVLCRIRKSLHPHFGLEAPLVDLKLPTFLFPRETSTRLFTWYSAMGQNGRPLPRTSRSRSYRIAFLALFLE